MGNQISYAKLLGEYMGTLKGVLLYDLPDDVSNRIKEKIKELENEEYCVQFKNESLPVEVIEEDIEKIIKKVINQHLVLHIPTEFSDRDRIDILAEQAAKEIKAALRSPIKEVKEDELIDKFNNEISALLDNADQTVNATAEYCAEIAKEYHQGKIEERQRLFDEHMVAYSKSERICQEYYLDNLGIPTNQTFEQRINAIIREYLSVKDKNKLL